MLYFGIIVLQFVGHLLSGSKDGANGNLLRGLWPHAVPPRSAAARVPIPVAGHC